MLLKRINTTATRVAEMVNSHSASLSRGAAGTRKRRAAGHRRVLRRLQTGITVITALVQFFVVARVFKAVEWTALS